MAERTHIDIIDDAIRLLDSSAQRGAAAGQHGFERRAGVSEIAQLVALLNEMFQQGMDT